MDRYRGGGGDRYGNSPSDSQPSRHPRGGGGGGPPPSRPSDDPLINRHRGGFSGNLHPFDSSPPRYPLTSGGGGGFHPMDGDGGFRPLGVRGGRNFNPSSEFEVPLSGPRFNPEFEVPLSGQKRRFDFPGRGEPSPDRFGGGGFERGNFDGDNYDKRHANGGNFDRRQPEGGAVAKLFVGSVPKTATEDDIRPPFEEYGNVVEVALIKDKRSGQQQGNSVFASAGCCFIKYATSEEADRAIRALHNQYILPGGVGPIQVRYADGERLVEYKLFVGSLNKHATEKEVEEIFLPYGRVEDVYLMRDEMKQSRGCGFVKYSNRDAAQAAINALNGIYRMRGCEQPLIVRFADPKRPRPGETRGSPGFGGPGFGPRLPSQGVRPPNQGEMMHSPVPQNAWHPMNQHGMLPSDMGIYGKQSSAPMSISDNNLNSVNSSFVLKSILENDKLNGSNFTDWYRNLRIVLKMAKRSHVLERAVPAEPQSQSDDHRKVWEKLKEESDEVGYLMLACMSPEIQKGMEETPAYQMITQLKDMFQTQARQKRYEIMQKIIGCRMVEGTFVSTHVLKMKGYLDQLDKLGTPMAQELAGDIILNSLPPSYASFIMNYNMNGWDKTIFELHQMLKTAENNVPKKSNPLTSKSSEVLAVRRGVKKPNKKGKAKTNVQTPDAPASTSKGKGESRSKVPLSERKCYHCNKMGHWRRNCSDYLATLTKKHNLNEAGSSGTKEA